MTEFWDKRDFNSPACYYSRGQLCFFNAIFFTAIGVLMLSISTIILEANKYKLAINGTFTEYELRMHQDHLKIHHPIIQFVVWVIFMPIALLGYFIYYTKTNIQPE